MPLHPKFLVDLYQNVEHLNWKVQCIRFHELPQWLRA
jgi:hypothetical protein